jgi:Amino acid permease
MSLDALSSVAYGPEAIVLGLVAAGAAAVSWTVPISIVIALLLLVLVVSYRQVIAVHPDGGGSYAVAKQDLGRWPSLVAAASLVVDYVLTVAVSLAAGADSLASVFPALAHHPLAVTLGGLAVLAAINLVGIAESAKVLMGPTLLFIVGIFAIVIFGFFEDHPVAVIGKDLGPIHATEALGVVVILKAFSAGCSSLTGVEAIANAVPAFRSPAVKRAQRCEIALGVLLGAMLLGLAIQIRLHQVVPRGNVTILAQLSAGAFGTGWPFYVINLSVTLVLAFAANTSFGGLPVLLQLLAKDHRMPHLFALRAEKPVFRYGVTALAAATAGIRDRGIHRVHHQPNRSGHALAPRTRPSVAGLCPAQRHRSGAHRRGRDRLVLKQIHRRRVAALDPGALVDPALRPDRTLLRVRRQTAGPRADAAKAGARCRHPVHDRRPSRRGQLGSRASAAGRDGDGRRSCTGDHRGRPGRDSAAARAMARVGPRGRSQGVTQPAPQPGHAHRQFRAT